jgi:hypothetical protein
MTSVPMLYTDQMGGNPNGNLKFIKKSNNKYHIQLHEGSNVKELYEIQVTFFFFFYYKLSKYSTTTTTTLFIIS